MGTKKIWCTEVVVIDRGVLQIECPNCTEVFNALPSAFMPVDYRCPKCYTSIEIKLVAALNDTE